MEGGGWYGCAAPLPNGYPRLAATLLLRPLHVPSSHDGSTSFTFELHFSEESPITYKTLRDHAFTVSGGEIIRARRLEKGKNLRWEITVRPNSDGAVTIVLPVTEDCQDEGAICTADGRPLASRIEITVEGP